MNNCEKYETASPIHDDELQTTKFPEEHTVNTINKRSNGNRNKFTKIDNIKIVQLNDKNNDELPMNLDQDQNNDELNESSSSIISYDENNITLNSNDRSYIDKQHILDTNHYDINHCTSDLSCQDILPLENVSSSHNKFIDIQSNFIEMNSSLPVHNNATGMNLKGTHLIDMECEEEIGTEEDIRYHCKPCNNWFDDNRKWLSHLKAMHNFRPGDNDDAIIKLYPEDLTVGKNLSTNINLNRIKRKKKFSCNVCGIVFNSRRVRNVHNKDVHEIMIKELTFSNKCLECGVVFEERMHLRKHLELFHDYNMQPIKLNFPNMEAFLQWKGNIERETLCYYQQKSTTESSYSDIRYYCQRSGRNYPYLKNLKKMDPSRQRMQRFRDSIKLGIACTAEIQCQKLPNLPIYVTFYPNHYGHGKGMTIAQLSIAEQEALNELTQKGIPFEKLIEDLKGREEVNLSQMYPLKKRYLKWVKYAYDVEEYNTEISDIESVNEWVKICSEMEKSPILYCHQEDVATENEKFILIIMTEFQKHIFDSSSKEIICIDTVYRSSGVNLTIILIIDEMKSAFPVTYCVSSKIDRDILSQLFCSIKDCMGKLSPKYLMSNCEQFIYNTWVQVMNSEPCWLWSRWFVDCKMKSQLFKIKGNDAKRVDIYKTLQTILDCNNKDIFSSMFRNLIRNLKADKNLAKVGDIIMKKFGSEYKKWANCYRMEIDFEISLHLEIMHHTFHTVSKMGLNKRLYTIISVLMKVLRYKIMDRIIYSFDNEKLNLAIEVINLYHNKSMDIPHEDISSLSKSLWQIQTEDGEKVYVTQETEQCLDHCSLICKQCKICVHQFSCSCVNSMVNANMCIHIHAAVFKSMNSSKKSHIEHEIESLTQNTKLISADKETHNSTECATYIPEQGSPKLPTKQVIFISTQNEACCSTKDEAHFAKKYNSTSPQITQSSTEDLSAINQTTKGSSKVVKAKRKKSACHEFAINQAVELYKRIKLGGAKLNEESLTAITKHLNTCLDICLHNNGEILPRPPNTIPINAVYTIKPYSQKLELVSATKPTYKRTIQIKENRVTKSRKSKEELTNSPHVLVVSANENKSQMPTNDKRTELHLIKKMKNNIESEEIDTDSTNEGRTYFPHVLTIGNKPKSFLSNT